MPQGEILRLFLLLWHKKCSFYQLHIALYGTCAIICADSIIDRKGATIPMNEIETLLVEFVTEHFAVDSLRLGMDLREDLELDEGDLFEIASFAEDQWDIDVPGNLKWSTLGDLAEYIEDNI